ncbi:MAG: YbaN family protein [Pseudomonadota bacterium]|nr:YbaN family protein [Pseudomonadota bacterium]
MPKPDKPPPTVSAEGVQLRRRLAQLLWRAVAVLSLGLGLAGALIPVVPTVPFVLLSAWAAGKGWPAFERWLLQHPTLGPPVRHWRERGAVPRRAKWASTLMMTASAVGLQFVPGVALWLRIAVPAVMAAVALWLWQRPDA